MSLSLILSGLGISEPIEPGDVADDVWVETATIWVIVEIDAIAASGAFVPHPAVERIRDELGTEFLGRDDILETILDYDEDNEDLLDQLLNDGRVLSPVVIEVLGPIPILMGERIEAGDQSFIDPTPWLEALADLWVRDGAAPIGPRPPAERRVTDSIFGRLQDDSIELAPPPPAITEPARPEATAGDATAVEPEQIDVTTDVNEPDAAIEPIVTPSPAVIDSPSEPAESGSSFPQVPVIVPAMLALTAIAWLARQKLRRGVRSSTHGSDGDNFGDLVEVGRQMTAALDAEQIARLAVAEGVRLTSAAAGTYVRLVDGVALFTEKSSPGLFSDEPIAAGPLWRVIETGQPATVVLRQDPALLGASMAVAATPVIADGSVSGAIVVIRSAMDPFSRQQLDQLTSLAPITGTAMTAALAHRSALSDADFDGLTQLKNRRRLDKDLADLPRGATVGFAMVDIDHFKNFNDTNGHTAGDVALRAVADCIAQTVRSCDSVYRYGGEEFSVVLVGADEAEATRVMERVRAAVEATVIVGEENQPGGKVTISIGVVISAPTEAEGSAIAIGADVALYRAKHDGRNRVVVAQ
ncbi:diguanylate cyclase [Acidimicrobium ferrooxidans]|uniref:Diguanylate cyclase n=1 Tax=Acidimicrobium ferrooxidans TaxID=53635 RepID=A0ABS3AQ99_9ACTN|nr:diguanylate cyclase [Acidimicrobium ferrooxidans]